jgi:MFS family permease
MTTSAPELAPAPAVSAGRRRLLPLVALLGAHAVSLTGNMLMLIALPLYVLSSTGSASVTGLAGACVTVPMVLGGLLGGVVVDRLGYRRASVLADLSSGLVIVLVPLAGHTVGLPLWALLGLVFVSGLLDSPGQNARISLLPEVAAAAGVPVERAVGWFEAAERGARLAGAPVAGLLVVAIGALNVLALDAVTFLVSAGLLVLLVPGKAVVSGETASDERVPAGPEARGYWAQLREGLAFTAADPLLRAVVLLVVVTNLFDAGFANVLLPIYAQRELGGAVAFGLLVGAMGGGALAGSLVFGLIGPRLPRRITFVIAFTLAGGPFYLALAAGLPLPVLVGGKLLAGFCAGAVNPIIGLVMLERIPAGLRARVFGLVNAGCFAGMPLGALLAGFAIDRAGLRLTLLVVGVIYLGCTLSPLRGGPWRLLDPADRVARLVAEASSPPQA